MFKLARKGQEPDYRAVAVEESAEAPEETLARYYFHFVKSGGLDCPDADFGEAAALYVDQEYKHILNALLLADAHPDEIVAALGIPARVLEYYSSFFFDKTVFPHNLAKYRWVVGLPVHSVEKEHYVIALERGVEEVLSKYRVGWRPRLDPHKVTHEVLSDMRSRFVEHRGRSSKDPIAQAALSHAGVTLAAARQLATLEREANATTSSGMSDLKIALEVRSSQASPEAVGVKIDDVVTD